jgi:hypothetical protein
MKTHRRPVKQLDESLRQYMLSGMLLHMIAAAGRINAAVRGAGRQLVLHDVKNRARLLVFNAVQQWYVVDCSEIVELASRGRIERRLIEYDRHIGAHRPVFDNRGIELEKVWIVVVEAFRLCHKA